ncbi:helix-turn-helix domain-containing protein [Sorangium sp. So ce1153]|uniref:helix-turn-helix domain-containing protein n=1 Tax=Sorangium sp. So ce1153 TaxID=3133333 RepID=UPI003F63659C
MWPYDVAKILGVHPRTVQRWRARFRGLAPESKLEDVPRSGRPPSLSPADCARIEAEACRPPKDAGVPVTHCSCALLSAHGLRNMPATPKATATSSATSRLRTIRVTCSTGSTITPGGSATSRPSTPRG